MSENQELEQAIDRIMSSIDKLIFELKKYKDEQQQYPRRTHSCN